MATFNVMLRRQCVQTVEVVVDVDPPFGASGVHCNWANEAIMAAVEHADWDLAETEVADDGIECVDIT